MKAHSDLHKHLVRRSVVSLSKDAWTSAYTSCIMGNMAGSCGGKGCTGSAEVL